MKHPNKKSVVVKISDVRMLRHGLCLELSLQTNFERAVDEQKFYSFTFNHFVLALDFNRSV